MSDEITSAEYWTQVESIAAEILRGSKDNGQDISDLLHETIDGHQWVIYYSYNLDVLRHSKNENAYFEDFGKPDAEDFQTLMQQLAYAALSRDVAEKIAELEEEDATTEKIRAALDELERKLLIEYIEKHCGNVAQAARDVGVGPARMFELMRKHKLSRKWDMTGELKVKVE